MFQVERKPPGGLGPCVFEELKEGQCSWSIGTEGLSSGDKIGDRVALETTVRILFIILRMKGNHCCILNRAVNNKIAF